MPKLLDKLVEGTGGPFLPRILAEVNLDRSVVPRIIPLEIRQTGCRTGKEFLKAYAVVGKQAHEATVGKIRQEKGLSENYGAVLLPKSLFGRMNVRSKLIAGERGDDYIAVGLLPTENLKWDARRILSNEEAVVFVTKGYLPKALRNIAYLEDMKG